MRCLLVLVLIGLVVAAVAVAFMLGRGGFGGDATGQLLAPILGEASKEVVVERVKEVLVEVTREVPVPELTHTPDIPLTVEARVREKLAEIPTPTPTPTPPPMTTLRDLVERVRPSVVRIERDGGMGSGFITAIKAADNGREKKALIITNHHVIQGAQFINVTVNDRDLFDATVVEDDPYNDIAFIEICCGDFKALEFASNTDVAEGEQAIAIGYPLSLEGKATITDGIISATRFDNQYGVWIIQTDAAINPGNSGGPLVSSEGKVLGVNTRGFSNADGIGIAISLRTLNYIIDRLAHRAGDSIDLGEKVTYHDNTVYFLPPVTKLKAEQYMDSLIRRSITTPEQARKWQLRLVDGEYEIRTGLYDRSNNRYMTIPEQQEWLSRYHNDFGLQRFYKDQVCERQEEDFNDIPTTFFMVDLTTVRFDGVIQWIPCIK